ncbi:hypothetical protein [Caldalkalibacillus mannanilyticus]|uniref:hypothetical protein n=1 Tax=Caldalkalibacillus mannanilyticus TaxID=1418 RepID=UPI000468C381|nr:hypothetical protein [Caldalkalibacillus mannanilyticus]
MKVWKSLICVLLLSFMIVGSVSATAGQVEAIISDYYSGVDSSAGHYYVQLTGITIEREAIPEIEKTMLILSVLKNGVVVQDERKTSYEMFTWNTLRHIHHNRYNVFDLVVFGAGFYKDGSMSTDMKAVYDHSLSTNSVGESANVTDQNSLSKIVSLQNEITDEFVRGFELNLEGFSKLEFLKSLNGKEKTELNHSLELLLFDVMKEQKIGDAAPVIFINEDKGTGYILHKLNDGMNNLFVIEQNKNGEWELDSKDQKAGNMIPEKYYKD